MTKTIVALYDDLADARAAINNLTGKGFESDAISLVAYDPEGEYRAQLEQEPVVAETDAMVEGAGIGATLGGLVGLLAGLGAVIIPGVGPVVAGGALGAALLGTGAGMVTGGLAGALVGAGVEEDEAELYAEGVRRGGTLVVVHVPDDRAAGAESVLAAYNPADMERRGTHWREEGWTGYDPDAEPYMPTDVLREREYWLAERVGDNLVHMQAYDNYNAVFHRHYQNTFAVTEHPYERYEPAYRLGYRAATLPRYRGRDWDEIEPEVRREWEAKDHGLWAEFEPAIQQAWKEVSRDYQSGDDYEDYDEDDYDEGEAYEFGTFEPVYRDHFERTYADTGKPYEHYTTAYRYGYELAWDEAYEDRDWDEIEPQVRRDWEAREEDPWEDFKEAVKSGWEEVQNIFDEDEDYDYESFEPAYQQHYNRTYAGTGYPYEQYEPAYRYGYDLAWEEQYQNLDWEEVEPQARREWEADEEGAWEDFRAAVKSGWAEVQNAFDDDDEYGYDVFDPTYREHYNRTYVGTGFPYERYQPAYRLGYEMALDERYWDEDWKKIEPQAQSAWEARHDDPWEDFKEAVHVGWKETRDALTEYDYEDFDSVYRDHYDRTYVGTGFPYERYEPAYRLGYELAMEDDEDRDWQEVESEARREWESQENDAEEAWDEVKEAVKAGWDEVQDAFDGDED